jgi:hypothetical protein
MTGLVGTQVRSKILQNIPESGTIDDNSVDGVVEWEDVKDVLPCYVACWNVRPES